MDEGRTKEEQRRTEEEEFRPKRGIRKRGLEKEVRV